MKELKPCPFCGSEARLDYYVGSYFVDPSWGVSCDNDECPMLLCTDQYDTEQEAINAWNTRAERTCEIECFDDGWDGLAEIAYAYPEWELSCGHSSYGITKPNYCPNCGAKVVSE